MFERFLFLIYAELTTAPASPECLAATLDSYWSVYLLASVPRKNVRLNALFSSCWVERSERQRQLKWIRPKLNGYPKWMWCQSRLMAFVRQRGLLISFNMYSSEQSVHGIISTYVWASASMCTVSLQVTHVHREKLLIQLPHYITYHSSAIEVCWNQHPKVGGLKPILKFWPTSGLVPRGSGLLLESQARSLSLLTVICCSPDAH